VKTSATGVVKVERPFFGGGEGLTWVPPGIWGAR
jgi:hypothetical protein